MTSRYNLFNEKLKLLSPSKRNSPSIVSFEFFKTKGNRHRLVILVTLGFFSQWSGNAIISYYLTKVLDQVGITNQKEQLEINGGLGIWGWIVALGSSLLIDKFGRRKMFLLSTFLMMIVYVPYP